MATLTATSVLVGNVVRFAATFTDDADALQDPTDVTILVGLEGESGTELTVLRDSLGTYHADWDTTGLAAGTYRARVNGTGAIVAAKEIKIKLCASRLTN